MTFEPLDLTRLDDVDPVPVPEFDMRVLPLTQLGVNPRYQRVMGNKGKRRVASMARDFSWAKFGALVVADQGGDRFAILDGQHRARVAAIVGIDRVPCIVLQLDQVSDEASTFLGLNKDRVAVSAFGLLKAGLAAQEVWALTSVKAVEDAGCQLMTALRPMNARRPGEIYGVTMIRQLVVAGKAIHITRGLRAVRRAGNCRAPGWSDVVLRQWLMRVSACPDLSDDDLVSFCRAVPLSDVLDRADRMRTQDRYRSRSRAGLVELQMKLGLREMFGPVRGGWS